jgi:hypothetical protein
MMRFHCAVVAALLAATLLPAVAQNPPPRSAWLPDAFEFGEGHAYMGREWVKWEHDKLVVGKRVADMKGKGEFEETVEQLNPPREAWEQFWKRVDTLGVWQWKADYSSERSSMPDGESWGLNLKYGVKQVKSKGYNAVPDGYAAFREAVRALVEDARRRERETPKQSGPGKLTGVARRFHGGAV